MSSVATTSTSKSVAGTTATLDSFTGKGAEELQALMKATKEALDIQGVIVPIECEQFILRCIRVCNYDEQEAAKLVKNFRDMAQMPEMRGLFSNFDPTLLKGLYEKKVIYPLSKRGPTGQLIIVAHAENWDPWEYNFDQAMAALSMLYDIATANYVKIQEEGIIFIYNFGGWSFKMVRAISISQVKIYFRLLQTSTPANVRAFHIINHPHMVKLMFAIVKPFVDPTTVDKIHFHEDGGTTSLRKEFDSLPESLGGTAGGDGVDRELLELLYKQDKYYQDLEKFSYPPY